MKIKDLLRQSFICLTAKDTLRIFNNLTKENNMFEVYQIKNDFKNHEKNKTD